MNVTLTLTPREAMFILIMVLLTYNFIIVFIKDTNEYPHNVNEHHFVNKYTEKKVQHKYPPIPSLVGIGPEKTGTTSLAYMLSMNGDQIPEVVKPMNEPTGVDSELRIWLPCGNQNFDQTLQNVVSNEKNHCSLEWYQHFWNIHPNDIRNSDNFNGTGKYFYYFEKSPAYWCYEHVAFLFSKLLIPQGTKFFVLLRDPIKRTYSYWSHQRELNNVRETWRQYIDECMTNNVHMHKMIALLKNKSKKIMQIEKSLLNEWTKYVYAKDRKYGYIDAQKEGKNVGMSGINMQKIKNRKKRKLYGNGGGVAADSNAYLGLAASCYVVPLLMWLKYVPTKQLTLIQSELVFGYDHNEYVRDLRCWYANGYEYESMNECKESGNKNVNVTKVHLSKSAKEKISKKDAEIFYNAIFEYCNNRLNELINLTKFKNIPLQQWQFNLWYH